jgi:hypothetical protein
VEWCVSELMWDVSIILLLLMVLSRCLL